MSAYNLPGCLVCVQRQLFSNAAQWLSCAQSDPETEVKHWKFPPVQVIVHTLAHRVFNNSPPLQLNVSHANGLCAGSGSLVHTYVSVTHAWVGGCKQRTARFGASSIRVVCTGAYGTRALLRLYIICPCKKEKGGINLAWNQNTCERARVKSSLVKMFDTTCVVLFVQR